MPSILVLGASGIVGRFLLDRLTAEGAVVTAVSRNARPTGPSPGTRWWKIDLSAEGSPQQLPPADVLISLLPIWMTATVLRSSGVPLPARILAFSSTSAITKEASASTSERQLAARLTEGEEDLASLHPSADITIFRPTMIYGGPGDRNVEKVAGQLRRNRYFPLVGSGKGLRQPVHADDLAAAAVQAISVRATVGNIYTLAGGEVLTFRTMIERIGDANGVRPRFIRIPLPLARIALSAASVVPRFASIPPESIARMDKDMTFDNSDAQKAFAYLPRNFQP